MGNLEHTRRHFLGASVALGSAAAFGFKAQAQSREAVTYMTPFGYLMDYVETIYGKTSGIFEKRNVDLKIEGGRGSSMAIQQLSAGNILVSRTGGTDLLKAYAKSPDLVAIANVYPKDLFWVIGNKETPINSVEDMVGKTIGVVSVGGATENLLDMMLAKAGIEKSAVKREAVGTAPAAFELIAAGRISAYISTNLTLFLLQQAGRPVNAWSIDKVAPSPGDLYVTTKKAVKERPEALANFLLGVHDTLGALTTAKPEDIIKSVSSGYDLPETKRLDGGVPALEFAMKNFKYVYDMKLKPEQATFDSAQELLVKAGLLQPLADKDYLDMSIWQRAFG
ncbi:ABC transporter substrate-binding protein [Neorhizobium alkalisoli]|uniref:NitT/TauT family transport system substrate-binding protein n=1 Tax=Neorhizobium alkalisoli TaxID=528178 RepID=A0A561R7M1_9HYPH|nr:ABC transporter substrate-binding protein [Neorhizobium alkalisoli]TWF58595.1 NitT/TauT family transport system substrate-binding protein [Neorhizobium alkalisoli]